MDVMPLVDRNYPLQKMENKGGWTFIEICEIPQSKNRPFGMVRVRGFIDDYEIQDYNLMPMGKKNLFLPVKALIRKKIKKTSRRFCSCFTFEDVTVFQIPKEIIDCFLMMGENVLERFLKFTEGEQKAYVNWIQDAKTIEIKEKRILSAIEFTKKGVKFSARHA